jgi:CRISPR system Cascade subunit CasB
MTINFRYKFLRDDSLIRKWYAELHEQSGHRWRAMLRRSTTPQETLLLSPFYDFYSKLIPELKNIYLKNDVNKLLAIAAIAGLLAHIKEDDSSSSFASQLGGASSENSQATVSELRFNKLQKSQCWDEFYRRLRRSVQLLRGKVNIISLSDGILHWAHDLDEGKYRINPTPDEQLLVRWAIEYFQGVEAKR